MDNFAYDAPDYFLDFSKDLETEDITKAEAFFATEHKNHFGVQVETTLHINDSERDLDQEFFTPMKEAPQTDNSEKCLRSKLRKSLSMSNIPLEFELKEPTDDISSISEGLENLEMSAKKTKAPHSSRKSHAMVTRAHRSTIVLRTRAVSRDHLDKLSQPKRKNVSHEDLQASKYVSMAEAINRFQQKTPMRFHSQSKPNYNLTLIPKMTGPKPTTIPQSPALATKQRAKRQDKNTQILTREEQELKEYEEAQKHKIKANPLNPRILKGPVQAKVPTVKKITNPEPFKLTEVIKKPATPPKMLVDFHARPVPKCLFEMPKPIIKSSLHTTAKTPRLMKRYQNAEPKIDPANETKVGQPLKVFQKKIQPFSFDERDKELHKKREQLVNEILEEEKKAREFHARPMPKSVFKSPQAKNFYQKPQRSNLSTYKSVEDLTEGTMFKARPAKVLQQKPFEPKKDEEHQIEVAEFQLSTYYRAKQREEFEQKKKEKEEKIAMLIKQREETMLLQAEEEKARIRKETLIKAQPIRRYKEVLSVPAKQLTAPISPNFSYDKTKKKQKLLINKENSINNSNTNEL